jgi:hypothetical protein
MKSLRISLEMFAEELEDDRDEAEAWREETTELLKETEP